MPHGLVRNGDMYYVRLRVPADIRPYIGRTEIKKSLHTTRYKDAKSLVTLRVAEVERLYQMIRSGTLTDDQIRQMADTILDAKVALFERQRLGQRVEIDDAMQQRVEDENNLINYMIESDKGFDMYCSWQEDDIAALRKQLGRKKAHTLPYITKIADAMLKRRGIQLDKESTEYVKLCDSLLRANIKAESVKLEHLQGNYDTDYDVELRKRKKTNTLNEVLERHLETVRKTTKSRTPKKCQEKLDKFRECFQYETGKETILLSEIDYQLTLRVAERLTKYPLYRGTRYPGMSLEHIYKQEMVEYPAPGTARDEMYLLSTIYDLAVSKFNGLDRNFAENIATDVLGKETAKESDYRDIFRRDDIQALIYALAPLRGTENQHLLWIPLTGFLQGARINEICQLYLDDVSQLNGIWCFRHSEDRPGKSLKNKNSHRINPIHPTLLDLGFLDFLERQRTKGYTRLWEGETRHSCAYYETQSNHSHYFGKWFNGTFKSSFIDQLSNPYKQTFHSSRHSFINWYYQNVPSNALDWTAVVALSGHLDKDDKAALVAQGFNPESMAWTRYSKDLNIERQLETLKLLDYGVDLSPLKG